MTHPLAGTALCRLEEIEDGEGRGFLLFPEGGSGEDELAIFVVRQGERAYGYLNSCPHQGTTLDLTGFHDEGRFVSLASGNILCATHGAQFRVEDGFCLWGPCAGHSLQPVAISRDADGLLRFQGLGPQPRPEWLGPGW